MSRALSNNDIEELKVLFNRRTQIMPKIAELKNEWHELSDTSLSKEYKVSSSTIWQLRHGKTHKCTAQ
jgi:hypothetical protein